MKIKVVKRFTTIVAQVGAVLLLAHQHHAMLCHGFSIHPMNIPFRQKQPDRRSVQWSVHLERLPTSIFLSRPLDAERKMGPTRLHSLFRKTAHDDENSRVSQIRFVQFWTRIPRMLKTVSKIVFARQTRNNISSAVDVDTENQGSVNGAEGPEENPFQVSGPATTPFQPTGTRWAIAANTTQLSGNWRPIVTPAFRQIYDEYLQNCSEPLLPRKLITSLLHTTREVIDHNGRNLTMTSTNPAGTWSRTLVSSGADNTVNNKDEYDVVLSEIIDPDKESVTVESWWDDHGTVHRSVLRGKSRVHGGTFETLRYLEKNDPSSSRDAVMDEGNKVDDILIVESFFHPSPESQGFRNGHVQWRYERE
jgi:hypothetical protein